MEDPEIRAREYIQQAYVEGGPNDVAVLAQLAQAEALLAVAAALTRLGSQPAPGAHSGTGQMASGPAYQVTEIRRKHPRAYARWTPEDDAALLDATRAGHGIDSLVGTFGRQPGAIRSRLARLGVQLDDAERHPSPAHPQVP
jgi:hypothetical protein